MMAISRSPTRRGIYTPSLRWLDVPRQTDLHARLQECRFSSHASLVLNSPVIMPCQLHQQAASDRLFSATFETLCVINVSPTNFRCRVFFQWRCVQELPTFCRSRQHDFAQYGIYGREAQHIILMFSSSFFFFSPSFRHSPRLIE